MWSSTPREASGGDIIRRMATPPRLTELPARYNAAETFIDSHRGVRESAVAIRCQGKSVTYGELASNVDRCGNAFRELGIGLEQRILILCLDSPAFVYAFFGAIKIGAVPVPTNTLLTPRDLAYILNDSRAVAVVVSAPLLAKVLEIRADAPRLRHVIVAGGEEAPGVLSLEKLLAAADDELDPADTTPDDACLWLYSSGTTGFPKGAVHLQHDMVYCTDTYGAQVLRTTEDDRHFTVSPLFHAYGLGNGVFFPFAVGASSVYKPDRATPDLVYSLITQEKPTILFTAPTFYAALLAYPSQDFKYDLSSLRMCVSAGEALPKTLFDQWKKRFGLEILDGIGATEMLHIFISNYPGKAKGGTSGTPVPGYRAKIVDDDGAELGKGETGNLWVSGDSCAAYYWNKHEKSKAAFKGEWYVTGDKDELVKPKAFVLLKNGRKPSDELAEELKAFVKGRITPYKYPRWIEFVPELPKTVTGKIQRYKLRERE